MVPVIYRNGLYVGDHVTLQLHAKICDRAVKVRKPFVVVKGDEIYICGYIAKRELESIVSSSEEEDCKRIRGMYAIYRKDTGKREMPLYMIAEKDRYPFYHKIKVRFKHRERIYGKDL